MFFLSKQLSAKSYKMYIFESTDQHTPREESMSDDDDAKSVESLDYIPNFSLPGKRRKLRY